MRAIWKYELTITDEQSLHLPPNAELLTVQLQFNSPMLWAVVDPVASWVYRTIFIHGTGHPVDPRAQKYVGTFQTSEGFLVWHVFDGGEK